MILQLEITPSDVAAVKELVDRQRSHPIVQRRMRTGVGRPTERGFWRAQLIGLLTTQNKSGRGSAVDVFLRQKPFPLTVRSCRDQGARLSQYIYNTLETTDRRFRRWKRISSMAAANFVILEAGGWRGLAQVADRLLEQRNSDASRGHYKLEREAAHYVQDLLEGLGPKQSRNFWQSLRLTRYEIPLDSRILRWCRTKLGLRLPTQGLANIEFYELIMDAIMELCARAEVLPTEFDAAVFSSFERDGMEVGTTDVADDEEDE